MNIMHIGVLGFSIFLLSAPALADSAKTQNSAFDTFKQIKMLTRGFYCPDDRHKAAKEDLAKIFTTDQNDRLNQNKDMSSNDAKRRVKVAVIASNGCLIDKDDYYKASLIFQHGVLPEHYLQAIIYANKAVDLGDLRAGPLREATIDRYLMSLGAKQIFATQVSAPVSYKEYETDADQVPCLWPVESDIDLTRDYPHGTLSDRKTVQQRILMMKSQISECDFPALSSKDTLKTVLKLKI